MKRFCKVNTCTADFTQKLIQNNNKKMKSPRYQTKDTLIKTSKRYITCFN